MTREPVLLELPLGIDMTLGASPETIKRQARERLALALCADPGIVERHFSPNEYSLVLLDARLVARYRVPDALQRQLFDARGKPVQLSTRAQDIVDLADRVDRAVQRGTVLLRRVVDATLAEVPADAIADIERETGVSTAPLRTHLRKAREPLEIGTYNGSHSLAPAPVRTNYIRDEPIDIRAEVLAWPSLRAGLKLRVVDAQPAGPEVRELMARASVTGHLDAGTPLAWRHAAAAAFAFGQTLGLRVRVIESTTTCRPQALAIEDVVDLPRWQPQMARQRSQLTEGQARLWPNAPDLDPMKGLS